MLRHTLFLSASVMVAMIAATLPASAGLKRDLVIGGVVVDMAVLASQAAELVTVAVASTSAANCAATNCAADLVAFIDGHPHVGRTIVNHELRVYAKKNLAQSAGVAQVHAALNAAAAQKQTDTNGAPIARDVPPPPGDCTPQQQNDLQQEVDQNCKGGESRCLNTDGTDTLMSKLARNRQCVAARDTIMRKCFRGGDYGHRVALDNAIGSVTRCEKILGSR